MKNKQKQTIKYFSVGKGANTKNKNISHQAIKSPNCSGIAQLQIGDKSDQDLKWLEKLVTGFEWYKIKKDSLFNDDSEKRVNNDRKDAEEHAGKSYRQISGMMKKSSNRQKQVSKVLPNQEKQLSKTNSKLLNTTKISTKTISNKKITSYRSDKVQAKVQSFRSKDPIQKPIVTTRQQNFLKKNSKILSKPKQNQGSINKKPSSSSRQFIKTLECVEHKEKNQKDGQIFDKIEIACLEKAEVELENEKVQSEREERYHLGKGFANVKKNRSKLLEKEENVGRIVKNNKSVEERRFHQESSYRTNQKQKNQKAKIIYMDGPVTEMTKIQQKLTDEQLPLQQKQQIRNKRIESLKKQLKFNNYQYYIENGHTQNPISYQLQQKKKQRKLNCSVGNARNIQSEKQLQINNKFLEGEAKIKNRSIVNSILVGEQNKENDTSLPKNRSHDEKIFENMPFSKFKYAISTKNSAIMTQENSYVLQKISEEHNCQPMELPHSKSVQEEWNVIQIFKKLDRKNIGVLNSHNCAIQSLSRELRYIFGAILEQILYANIELDLYKFISKVDETLNKTNFLNQNKKSYFQLKELAMQTERNSTNMLKKSTQRDNFTKNKKSVNQILRKSIQKIQDKQNNSKFKLSNKKQNAPEEKSIRFATFQNQSDEDKLELQHIVTDIYEVNQRKNCSGTSNRGLENELQRKLRVLNENSKMLSFLEINKNQTLQTETYADEQIEMQKLDRLNKRLEKYLIDQSITKLESTDKFRY